jgi:hypothetical protein
MTKKRNNPGKMGRDEEIAPEELLKRYAALKRFLEDNWGRIGLALPRVRKPEKVRALLNLAPNAKWHPAFRDFPTGCLLLDGSVKVSWRQLRETREQHKQTQKTVGLLSLESHNAHQAAQAARIAFEAAVAEFQHQQDAERTQLRLRKIAKHLRVEELTQEASQLGSRLQQEQQRWQFLGELLNSQSAWFARNEVVGFIRDREKRYRKTSENYAKAMAGLPYYDWLYSVRKCLTIPNIEKVPSTQWFQVFELLKEIVKKTKPVNLRKIESKLKTKLLREDTDPFLRSYIAPQWYYMELAFDDCRGKRFRPAHLPYKIMGKFLDHYEGPSVAEAELAKHNQLA